MILMNLSRFPQGRRRVAHVTLGLDVGGQEKLLVEFARHADPSRFDLCFISLTGRGRLAAEIERQGWPVLTLDAPPGIRPALILRLARLFRRLRLDVVHTHDDKPLLYGAPAARLAGVPRVVHTKHYGAVAHIGRRHRALARLATRFTDHFVCVSEDSARLTAAQGGASSAVRTICNGIDLARFGYTGPRPGGPIVTVARLSPEKDVATLLRATALALSELPNLRVEIAGAGPCLPDLQRLAGDLGLGANVRFLGERRDVPELLAQASLFVLPSYTEGISLTLLEAMARGLPVIAMRVGGNPEVVSDGATGVLVPPRDPVALAEAMLRLQRDADLSQRLGRAGRERVECLFDIRHMVASYECLYRGSAPTESAHRLATDTGTPFIQESRLNFASECLSP
jgi:sugar transferase (PEP-CTERM/EpsH1 system associated)